MTKIESETTQENRPSDSPLDLRVTWTARQNEMKALGRRRTGRQGGRGPGPRGMIAIIYGHIFPDSVPFRCTLCRRSRCSGGGGRPRTEGPNRGRRRNGGRRSGGRWQEVINGQQARGHAEEGHAQPVQPSHLQVGGG